MTSKLYVTKRLRPEIVDKAVNKLNTNGRRVEGCAQ